MNTEKKYKFEGVCGICTDPITGADTQAQFNRNKGLHNRRRHGIASPTRYVRKKDRIPDPKLDPLPEGQIEQDRLAKRKEYARQYRAKARAARNGKADPVNAQVSNAEPAFLSQCCSCGTRFYMVK